MFDIPVVGTMAHSFVQSFDSEYMKLLKTCTYISDDCLLLVEVRMIL